MTEIIVCTGSPCDSTLEARSVDKLEHCRVISLNIKNEIRSILPLEVHHRTRNQRVSFITACHGYFPVGDTSMVFRSGKLVIVKSSTLKLGDCAVSCEYRECGDDVPAGIIESSNKYSNLQLYVYDITEVDVMHINMRVTSMPGVISLLHRSGFFVTC